MDKKIIKFDNTEIEEYEFHQHKSPIPINHIDINPSKAELFEVFIIGGRSIWPPPTPLRISRTTNLISI